MYMVINKNFLKASLISLAVLSQSNCSSGVDGSSYIGMQGSALWFKTASQATKNAYFNNICEGYGFKKGTNQFATCIQTEVNNQRNRNAAGIAASLKSYPTTTINNTYNNNTTTAPAYCTNGRVMTKYGCRYR